MPGPSAPPFFENLSINIKYLIRFVHGGYAIWYTTSSAILCFGAFLCRRLLVLMGCPLKYFAGQDCVKMNAFLSEGQEFESLWGS